MLIRDFNALRLKGSELVKITLRDGTIVKGVILDETVNVDRILIYNVGKEQAKKEEYIKLETIEQLEIIS